jgi:hypothetical protein
MIRPTGFARDEQAADTNAFMQVSSESEDQIRDRATAEFDQLVGGLRDAGVDVQVFEDELELPDSVFPNNWVSFHQPVSQGEELNPLIVTYPMLATARRKERRAEVLDAIAQATGSTPDHIDLSGFEENEEFLEGTGSLVLDRTNGIAYASISARTSQAALDAWCDEMEYELVSFHSADREGNPIYHTNVVMSIGEEIAVVCLESIIDPDEYDLVEQSLKNFGRKVVGISFDQVEHFCGNILELQSKGGESVFAMSDTAYRHFTDEQRAGLESKGVVVHPPIPTIEHIGGGSVRCMIAELGI